MDVSLHYQDRLEGDLSACLIVDLGQEDKEFKPDRLDAAFEQMKSDVQSIIKAELVSRLKEVKARIPQEKEF
jgi:hypothetical protein